jgi:uncharacterized tannase-like protein DUF6351
MRLDQIAIRGRPSSQSALSGCLLVLTLAVLLYVATTAAASAAVRLETPANRADLISGPATLVRVTAPPKTQTSDLRVFLGAHDVSSDFAQRPDGSYEGLLDGLQPGPNVVKALLPDGSGAQLTITDHPIGGPVFSGPQIEPWVCGTEAAGLGPATDAQCDAPSSYSYEYMSSATGRFEAYDPASPPQDVATTTTDQGATVPYIVRIEKGAADRGLFEIAVLDNPKETWEPWRSQQGWNHKLVVPFGGGTDVHHSQDAPTSTLNGEALSRGFMVADSGLNIQESDVNANVSAEALMMLKEHIIDAYGPIRYTIGEGCSGGGIQQYEVAAMYPGLLNGIQPNCSFPDTWSTAPDVVECHRLVTYFEANPTEPWVPQIDGHKDPSDCAAWALTFWNRIEPGKAANCNLPAGEVYNPETNPTGARCTIEDYEQNIWGPRPSSEWGPVEQRIDKGFANTPFDNVGVQYGLKALQAGLISPAEFANINAQFGCYDIDASPIAHRCAMNSRTARIVYRAGQVTDARQLASVPIIDLRGWDESAEIHTSAYSYVMRARLDAENGTHENQIIWTYDSGSIATVSDGYAPEVALKSFLLIDKWLSNIEADRRNVLLAQKVREDKPAEAVDACFPENTAQHEVMDQSTCETRFPHYETTRSAAGAPFSGQTLKCQLKPLSRGEYDVAFTDEQWTELQRAFPTGVCDYGKPGVGERASIPWMSFQAGPGGKPLKRPPSSKAIKAQ